MKTPVCFCASLLIALLAYVPDGRAAFDLVPAAFAGVTNVVPGQSVDVSWVVANNGPDEARPSWIDAIYFSSDSTLDVLDVRLVQVSRTLPVAAGGTYAQATTLMIPQMPAGNYFLILKVDSENSLVEADEGNNQRVIGISVGAADLAITTLSAPPLVLPGQQVEVAWTTRNVGAGDALGSWSDGLYLSRDAVLDPNDTSLGTFARSISVPAGREYVQVRTITIPQVATGSYFLIARADSANAISEPNETNNERVVAMMIAMPDLVPTQLSAPGAATTRERFEVTWKVNNIGSVSTIGSWTDQLFLSTDDHWDAADELLGSVSRSITVASSNSYLATIIPEMPARPPGHYYLIVRVDHGATLGEANETNNEFAVSIRVNAPDLAPTSFQASSTVPRGQPIQVSWTVINQGAGFANPAWNDQIYLSQDDVWDPQDQLLAYFTRQTTTAAGSNYTQFQSVTIPNVEPGSYYLILRVDGAASMYESNEANNDRAVPVAVNVPDLAVGGVTAPAKASVGQPMTVAWIVTNRGPVQALPSWSDRVYISRDAVLDLGDLSMGDFTRSLALGASEAYQRTATINFTADVPGVIPGAFLSSITNAAVTGSITREYWLNVNGNTVGELTGSPAFPASPSAVEQISSLEGPRDWGDNYGARIRGFLHPPRTANYTFWIASDGESQLFLSLDANPTNKTLIASDPYYWPVSPREWFRYGSQRSSPIALEAGRTYYIEVLHKEASGSDHVAVGWNLPQSDYFVIVQTDASGAVFEGSEGNNTATVPISMSAVDLQPSALSAPEFVAPGRSFEVSWAVTNRGPDAAIGSWSDRLYLSADNRYDASDLALLTLAKDGGLLAGRAYPRNQFTSLPATAPGNYFLVLRADADNQVAESDDGNNDASVPITVTAYDQIPTSLTAASSNALVVLSWSPVANAQSYNLYVTTSLPLTKGRATKLQNVTSPFVHSPLTNGNTYYYFATAVFAGGVESGPSSFASAQPGTQINSAPDLVAMSVSGPAQVAPRQRMDVVWQVRNAGARDAVGGYDTLFLSADDRWDAADTALTSVYRSTLLVGDTARVTVSLDMPLVPAGKWFLLVRVDHGGNVSEGNEANNEAFTPITVVPPDLSAQQVSAPAVLAVGQTFELLWTVKNLGSGAAMPNWADEVVISVDRKWDISDRSLTTATRYSSLETGVTYTVTTTLSLPSVPPGNWFLVLKTDQGSSVYETTKTNNEFSIPLTITAPDLVPTALSAPPYAGIGQPLELSWTVRNQGNSPTLGGWNDRLYLSRDNVWDATDQDLGYVTQSMALVPGDNRSVSSTIILPTVPLGGYFIILRADADGVVLEASEGNNERALAIDLKAPDLTPVDLVGPTNASVAQTIEISWLVLNQGPGEARPTWRDQVYLSSDPVWDLTDRLLVGADRTAVLLSSNSYRVATSAQLPLVPPGNYYLIIRCDHNNSLYESNKLNNERTVPITIALGDLVPTSLTTPTNAYSRQQIEVSWTVKNDATGEIAPSWTDTIYLSQDATWDSTDQPLTYLGHALKLVGGASYVAQASLTLPVVPPGNYYLILRTDSGNLVQELRKSNNERAAPITLRGSDLTPTSLTVAKGPSGGKQIEVVWKVANIGTADAPAPWSDQLFISSDEVWDVADTLLLTTTRSLNVPVGQEYWVSTVVTLPSLSAKTYYVIVKTDAGNTVFESSESNNERFVPLSLTNPDLVPVMLQAPSVAALSRPMEVAAYVENRGGDGAGAWYDRVYLSSDQYWDSQDLLLADNYQSRTLPTGTNYSWFQRVSVPALPAGNYFLILRCDGNNSFFESNEANNDLVKPIQIITPAQVTANAAVLDGSTVGSLGPLGFSPDGIRLAAASGATILLWDLQNGDLRRRFAGHNAAIDTVQFSPTGDQLLSGARDGTARLFDADTRRQVRSFAATPSQPNPAAYSPDGARVITGSGLNLPRYWEAVTGVERTNFFGHTGAVLAVALSPDGTKAITGSEDRTAILWDTVSGRSLRALMHHSGSVTAVAFSPDGTRALTASSDGALILWNVATGAIESVYLHGSPVITAAFSHDGTNIVSCSASPSYVCLWQTASGGLLRIFQQTGGAQSQMNGAALSPDASLLATTHSDGFVRLWPSDLGVVALFDLNQLVFATPATTTLRSHGLRYYELNVEPGRNLVVSVAPAAGSRTKDASTTVAGISADAKFGNLKGLAPSSRRTKDSFPASSGSLTAVRIVASPNRLPSAYDATYFAEAPIDTLKAEIPIGQTTAGKYYVLVFSPYLSDGSIDLELRANYSDLYVSSATPSSAGNAGNVTVQIRGTSLTADTVPTLVGPGGQFIPGIIAKIEDPTKIYATFDLRGRATGDYDLRLEELGHPPSTLFSAMRVTAGVGPRLEARLIAPSAVRPSRDYNLTLEYANVGDADMAAPLFVVRASAPSLFELAASRVVDFALQFTPSLSQVQLLGVNSYGLPGLLPPGASCHVSLPFRAPSAGSQIAFSLNVLRADSTPIDWNLLESNLRPPGIADDAWSAMWSSFRTSIGDTWADYLRALDSQANLLALAGRPSSDVGDLLTALFSQAVGTASRRTLAASVDAQAAAPGLPLQFSRFATDSLAQRFTPGPLGQGWSHNFEYLLTQPTNGVFLIRTPTGGARRFVLDADGLGRGVAGEFGTLRPVAGGGFTVTEKYGLVWEFNGGGLLASIADPNQNRISLAYSGGQLVSVGHSAGLGFSLHYNAQGRLSRLTDHAGYSTAYDYDASGAHLLRVTAPGGVTNIYTYQAATGSAADHALTSITFPDDTHQFFVWDIEGRLLEQHRDNNTERVRFTHDANGFVTLRDANGANTALQLSDRGQLLNITDPLGHRVTFNYGTNLSVVRVTNPTGQATALSYDDYGNATQLLNPLGQSMALNYTSLSRLDRLQDARGQVMDFGYDTRGNLASIAYPDSSVEQFGYDTAGSVSTWQNRRGQTVQFVRNAQGQLTRKTYPDGRTIDYRYDPRGLLTNIVDTAGAPTFLSAITSLSYDTRDFLTSITYPDGKGFTFEHNAAGRRTRRVGHDSYTLNYDYNAAGRLQTLTDGAAHELIRYSYDSTGRLVREVKGNGTFTGYTYDLAGQIIALTNHAPSGIAQSFFNYTYDVKGNRLSMTTAAGLTSYEYDALNQLTGVTYPGGRRVAYAYDAAGNRTLVGDNGTNTTYTANSLNQYTQAGAATFGYDTDGNLIRRTDASGTTTYEYDIESRLVRVVTPTNGVFQYTYDALGNRTAAAHDGITNRFLHDPIGLVNVAAEYDATGVLVSRYNHAIGLVSRTDGVGKSVFYSFDALGNTRELSGDAGSLLNSYDYDAFGAATVANETVANSFRFVGRFGVAQDSQSLCLMRHRHYSFELGAFISNDPLRLAGGDTNLRRYVRNRVTCRTDPSGLGYFAKRPLQGLPFMLNNPLDDVFNTEVSHEQYFFDDGSNEGFGDKGRIKNEPYDGYEYSGDYFDDDIMRKAIDRIVDYPYNVNPFDPNSENCQEWAERLRDEYERVREEQQMHYLDVPVVRPVDPNDKLGPAGVGPNRVVSAQDKIEYIVRFENFTNATAPVQELVVVDYLDSNLDWTTVEFGHIAYGDRMITLPASALSASGSDMPPTNSISITGVTDGPMAIEYSVTFNPQAGRAEWRLKAVDTATGIFPEDALAGFLPPEDGSGRGNGHVTLSVKARADVPVGTGVTNKASIVFDTNEPIDTPPIWNMIGDVPSLSAVIAYLPGQVMVGTPFTYSVSLTNSGTDSVTNVILTNAVPDGMSIVSATATRGTVTVTNGMVRWDLGTVAYGSGDVLTVTVMPTEAGTFANRLFFSGGSGLAIYSSPFDIVVMPSAPRLGIRLVGGQVVLFWSTNSAGFHPQKTASLAVPESWADITNIITLVGTEYQVTVGPPAGRQFYRLVKASVNTGSAPRLRIMADPGTLSLFWPTNATGFRLQRASALLVSATWSSVTNTPATLGAEFRVQLGLPSGAGFYRLISP